MEKMELAIIFGIMAAVIVVAMVFIALYPDGPPAAHGEGEHAEADDHAADTGHETVEDDHAAEPTDDHAEPTDDHSPAETH